MTYDIACVVPCRNEQDNIGELVSRVDAALADMSVAMVLVDDGSSDETWSVMHDVALSRKGVVCVRLATCGFGQEQAIRCGISHALQLMPRLVAVMDADMQDPPEMLPEMIQPVITGVCSQVVAVRKGRGHEGLIKRVGSFAYYRMVSKSLGIDVADIRNFRVMSLECARATMLRMPMRYSFKYESLRSWGDATFVSYPYSERNCGKTNYNLLKSVNYACDSIVLTSQWLRLLPVLCGVFSGILGLLLLICGIVFSIDALVLTGVVLLCCVPVHVGVATCCLFSAMAYAEARVRGNDYVEYEYVDPS